MSSHYVYSVAMKVPKRPGIYCRLSYAPDGSLEKVERQEADVRALFDRLGWPQPPPEHVYSDNSRSAWQRDRKRPEWERMLRDIEAGVIDGVGTYHGDRLMRQPWDLEMLLKLADDKHLPLASVSGTRDLSNEDDRFILRIEVAQACRESANTSRRVRRGWAARRERGEPHTGGKRPFGYGAPTGRTGRTGKIIWDYSVVVPEEAAILREIVERLLSGESLGGVVSWLNKVCTTTQGNKWSGRALKQVLRNPRIAGLMRHNGALVRGNWEAIITPEQWENVNAVLRRKAEEHGYAGRERRYLLSGIAECSGCGTGLMTKPSGGRNRKTARLYNCPNRECKQRVSRNVEHLDAYVTGRVLRLLNDERFLAALDAEIDDDSGVGAEIVALERRKREALETLENLADHPGVSPEVLVKAIASFDRKLADLRARIEMSSRDRLLRRMAGITREQWEREPIDVRAETVRTLYRVIVLPATWRGPGFDPKSVRMIRRT